MSEQEQDLVAPIPKAADAEQETLQSLDISSSTAGQEVFGIENGQFASNFFRQQANSSDLTAPLTPFELTANGQVIAPGAADAIIPPPQDVTSAEVDPPATADPVTVVGAPKSFNPELPSLVVLDDFAPTNSRDLSTRDPNHKDLISHGEISAVAAEQQGFSNVFRVDMGSESIPDGSNAVRAQAWEGELATDIEGLEHKINSGEIPLGRGDAVIMSFGNPYDPTFKEASTRFGIDLTAANLASKRSEFLDRLETIRDDPSHPESLMAANILRVNAAIVRLQEQGIHVIHAAGNDGPEVFSPGFMNASSQVKGLNLSGSVYAGSANHSLTTVAGPERYEVTFNPATSALELNHPDLDRPIEILKRKTDATEPGEPIRVLDSAPDLDTVFAGASAADPTADIVGQIEGTSFSHIARLPEYKRILSSVKEGRTLDGST